MSYTKTTWQDGDIITTEKLNKIENGIEQASTGGGESENKAYFPLSIDSESPMVITPFADILAATQKGIPCAVVIDNKISNFWGVGHIIMEGSTVNKITFTNHYSINTAGSTKSLSFSVFNLFSDGTVAVDNASVIAS